MPNNKRVSLALLVLYLGAIACNMPGGVTPTETPTANGSATTTFTPIALVETSTSTFTPIPEACKPTVTANTDANVRSGPGTVYPVVGVLPQGGTANPVGKNSDGTWWFIDFPSGDGGHAWIAASVTTAACIPGTLAIIAAPPTPVPPTFTSTFTPSPTPTITNTPLFLLPVFTFVLAPLGDITVQDVFLSVGGEVVTKIAVSGTMSGSFKYRVYVEGNLKVTKTATLPVGSQAYYSGYNVAPDIFDQMKTIKVIVDPGDDFYETDEGNNQLSVSCNSVSKAC